MELGNSHPIFVFLPRHQTSETRHSTNFILRTREFPRIHATNFENSTHSQINRCHPRLGIEKTKIGTLRLSYSVPGQIRFGRGGGLLFDIEEGRRLGRL